jgi:hypothetical protein
MRHKTFERTTITHGGATATAHVLNISETGAQVHSLARIRKGDVLRLLIAGRKVEGTAGWSDKGRFDFLFLSKLTPNEVGTLLR